MAPAVVFLIGFVGGAVMMALVVAAMLQEREEAFQEPRKE